MRVDGIRFQTEIAKTPLEQQRGLQHRSNLPQHRAMLFPYNKPQPLSFWMRDCLIPLDILFFKGGTLVNYADNAPPCRKEAAECPIYSAPEADTVLELRAGTRKRLGFNPGVSKLSQCPRQKQSAKRP